MRLPLLKIIIASCTIVKIGTFQLQLHVFFTFFKQVIEFIQEEMEPNDKVLIFVGRKVT